MNASMTMNTALMSGNIPSTTNNFMANAMNGQSSGGVPEIPVGAAETYTQIERTPADAEEFATFQENMSKAFVEIDLGWPSGMRKEALCMLDRGQVVNLMGGGARVGARFADLQKRFPDAVIQISVDEGMLQVATQSDAICTQVLQLARVFASQPMSWDPRKWCVCQRCRTFPEGCADGEHGVEHFWMTDAMIATFVGIQNAKIQNFCTRFPGINVRIEAADAVRPDGTRLLVLADMSTNEMPIRVQSCKVAAEIVKLYLSTPSTWNPASSWCACGKCQTLAGCVGHAGVIQNQEQSSVASSTPNTGKTDAVAGVKADDPLEVEDINMCNICFENSCDTRMVPCLHKICSECVKLVKESTRLMEQGEDQTFALFLCQICISPRVLFMLIVLYLSEEECCPFCRVQIKGFIGLRAKGSEPNAMASNANAKGAKQESRPQICPPAKPESKGPKQEKLMSDVRRAEKLMSDLRRADACFKCGGTGHWASR